MSSADSDGLHAGQPVDLARFARVRTWRGTEKQDLHWDNVPAAADGSRSMAREPGGPWHLGLEWDDPAMSGASVIRFAGSVPPGVKVQYWRRNWPTPAPERRVGARRGWIGRDDPWHGEWTTARGAVQTDDTECTFIFDPVDIWELGGRAGGTAGGRGRALPRTLSPHAENTRGGRRGSCAGRDGPARLWRRRLAGTEIDVLAGMGGTAPEVWDEGVEAVNGYVLGVTRLPEGLRVRLLCTDGDQGGGLHPTPIPADRTIITIRRAAGHHAVVEGFSFLPTDLARGPIHIPDLDVSVTLAGAPDGSRHGRRGRHDL